MTAPNQAFKVNNDQQQAIVKYANNCVDSLNTVWNLREQFLLKDLYYYRELDRSVEQQRAMVANRAGDPFKIQNLQVPVILPQVESALAYLSGVFLTGYPIFGVVANPALQDQALMLETVIADNSLKFGWPRELIMFMRDGLKYNFGAVEVNWKRCRLPSIINDPVANLKQGTAATDTFYEGNYLRRLDPYNTIWDKRVQPTRVHIDGEFAGYTELMSRIQLKQLFLDLNTELTMNAKEAFESGTASVSFNGSDSWYYIPQINGMSFVGTSTYPTTNWLAWAMIDGAQNAISYNNIYEVTTLYGRIIPQDFKMSVSKRNQPQIWKFIIVNRKVVVFVERQTNAHNNLPILFCQPNEDGLGYQTKSFLDNAIPFQSMSTSLWNATIESKRRQVFDRILYDPSRIRKEDIDKVTSVARIPVKQSAYGKPIGESVYAFPYRDDNIADTLQMAESINAMADIANGQNKVDRGQFQKGNKTRTEFVTTMGNSNSRQQLGALMLEHQVYVPMKEMIKLNVLQYQPAAEYYNTDSKNVVSIKPEELRKVALQFKVSDGMLPTEKFINTELLQVFMQTVQTSPLMQAEYDMVSAFAYWCKTQGAQWFEDFKRTPEERKQVLDQLAQVEAAGKSPAARPQNQQGTQMPRPKANKFTAFEFTQEELFAATRFTQLNLMLIQTLIAEAMEERSELAIDLSPPGETLESANIKFLQREAAIKGKQDALEHLLMLATQTELPSTT